MSADSSTLVSGTSGLVGENLSIIVCRNSQGAEVRGTVHRLSRHLAVFEVYNPYSILQLSEVLTDFRVTVNDRMLYSGRAVITNLVNTGIMLILEVSLDDEAWIDVDVFNPVQQQERLVAEFTEFLQQTERTYKVWPDFKVVVADMQTLLTDLRRWMEQVELGVRSMPAGDRHQAEIEIIQKLEAPVVPIVLPLMRRFEDIANQIPQDIQPVHRSYIKRQLHPLVLCAPFVYRTYAKPLGYAGDYEMVSMMLRDPYEGSSVFAKLLNKLYLEIPPVIAHRNRIIYLVEQLTAETQRATQLRGRARIYNLGCGPAQEIQRFLKSDVADTACFDLLDFNDETLESTSGVLGEIKIENRRSTEIQFEKRSVHQILKEAGRPNPATQGQYDVVYCAGLFDYLSDRICRRLLEIFYDMLAPGGLLIATNVHTSNPWRNWMEYLAEWHLVYRDEEQFLKLAPSRAPAGASSVKAEETGVNIFLEVRKPGS
ncbi:Methyltransferase domain-containing protein [Prosthecobacter debontii]|uniref:Methyltransferase domain-containing protein n=1 Tax=Prosthecobacter debontii TaxID=48467 RepID=A0A1T4YAP0_9BACT|nr:class I SAM-dependent methyltransferase [Prosthecobacter debontii]SKA98345.1 Methyltransferase domain-containing protein [Prosthecobacter debontii]